MGEGMVTDAALFPLISSANIACGGHAGDTDSMRRSVEQAIRHGVAIGAHPSYPDRSGFGRVDLLGSSVQLSEIIDIVGSQIARLAAVCRELGVSLRHVKPHGALYNRAARDAALSQQICRAIVDTDPALLLYGLSGSEMGRAAAAAGLRFVSEVFADRTYCSDGSLTPRSQPHALISDPAMVASQVVKMVQRGRVDAYSADGVLQGEVSFSAETICLHGDGEHAVEFAGMVREVLSREGVVAKAPDS